MRSKYKTDEAKSPSEKKFTVVDSGGLIPLKDSLKVEKNERYLQKVRNQYMDISFIDPILKSCAKSVIRPQSIILEMEEIKEGNINLCFLVKLDCAKLFVKKYLPFARNNPKLEVALYSNSLPTDEAKIMEFVQKMIPMNSYVKIPHVVGYSEKEGILITQYLTGCLPLFAKQHNELLPVCGDIGSFLRCLHDTEEPPPLVKIYARAQGTFERIALEHSKSIAHAQLIDKISEWTAEHSTVEKVLIHGDFSPKNLLWNGETVFLIDFQDVMYGDRSRDIGQFMGDMITTCIKGNLPPEMLMASLEAFWKGYAGRHLPEVDAINRRSRIMAGMVLLYRGLGLYDYGSGSDTETFSLNCYHAGQHLILTDTPLLDILAELKINQENGQRRTSDVEFRERILR